MPSSVISSQWDKDCPGHSREIVGLDVHNHAHKPIQNEAPTITADVNVYQCFQARAVDRQLNQGVICHLRGGQTLFTFHLPDAQFSAFRDTLHVLEAASELHTELNTVTAPVSLPLYLALYFLSKITLSLCLFSIL